MIRILLAHVFSKLLHSLFIYDFNGFNIFHQVGLYACYFVSSFELRSWAIFPGVGLQGKEYNDVLKTQSLHLAHGQGICSRSALMTLIMSSLLQSANNLIVLGREEAGAEKIFQNNGVALLLQLVDTKKPELMLAAVRTLSGMCSGHRARVRAWVWGSWHR